MSVLFLNATIIDGSGNEPRYIASVYVRHGLIDSIRAGLDCFSSSEVELARKDSSRIIDCENGRWVLCPGFIDMHAHSDLSLLHTPTHEAKITQGVTTEVIGQDGISYSPVNDYSIGRIREQISGWNGNPSEPPDFFDQWRTVGEYLNVLDRQMIATNAAYLVPQGNLRILAKGWNSSPATQDEIDAMKVMLAKSLEEGAVGMSSGLTYVPGMFAPDDEIAQLCKVVATYKGYFCPHTRSYGKGALQAYAEMIELARVTGVRLHLTHATMNYDENVGRANELIKMIDAAIASGIEITLDTYPYLAGSTTLASTLPSWVAAAEDPRAILSDPEQLIKIKQLVLLQGTDGCHGCTLEWDLIEIGGVANKDLASQYVGKTISKIASEKQQDPFETYLEILKRDNFNSTILSHTGDESNVRLIMRHPRHTGGSDGILTSTKPHPRGWGTFARYLGHYARDLASGRERNIYHASDSEVYEEVEPETIFDGGLEEAVAHITGRAASVIRIQDRGLVKEGFRADLVLFDPETIIDMATYANPKQPARGIRFVLVNGVIAVDEGAANGARAGKTVRLRSESELNEWVVR